jgi:antitoxin (DNA-binding transcriptional repressor) of toxin-antitoxin stability system
MDSVPSAAHGQPRMVNVHQAKTHLSSLIDAAHAGETILLPEVAQPCAALVVFSPNTGR